MPACDRWGIMPEGLYDAEHPNPFAWQAGASAACSGDAEDKEEPEDNAEISTSARLEATAPPPTGRKHGQASAGAQTIVEGSQRRCQERIIGLND